MQSRGSIKQLITVILAVPGWLWLWLLVPGLVENSVGASLADDDQIGLLIDIALAGTVLALLFLSHNQFNKTLFRKQPTVWLYLLPVAALILLPLRAGGIQGEIFGNPAWLYAAMMTANVATQQYLTFGLLQSYLKTVLRPWVAAAVTAVIFYLGHALLLPESFGPTQVGSALYILVLGLIFASLRQKTGTLHANLALHLAFYFIFI